jgi:hypothetical protein
MARRVLNRKELRVDDDDVERKEAEGEEDSGEEEPKKTAKKAVRRKTRSKTAKDVRLKAFWGVFNQAMAQVAQFEYGQREDAERKAKELTEAKKAPHFVQLVKKVIEE